MSHRIGQTKEHQQNSDAIQGSPPPQDQTDRESVLSDADYEFLFNQLLEGIAHGWHDRRIIKFFDRLGDRGKQEDWVAWLERLRSKIIKLPVQSKRQLGTVMIRLGELTQSTAQVKQIGAASHRIGRELLFGNTENVVWEYVGSDAVLDASTAELETAENPSERLPEDFTELGTATNVEEEAANVTSETESIPEEIPELPIAESTAQNDSQKPETVTEKIPEETPDNTLSEDLEAEIPIASTQKQGIEDRPSVEDLVQDSDDEPAHTYSDEFEFELGDPASEPTTENLIQVSESTESFSKEEQLLNLVESANSLGAAFESQPEDIPSQKTLDPDPPAIDMEKVMNLIQEDEELAQKISQKLNVSSIESSDSGAENNSVELDRSSVDLIESWFNLGLKQVSGGEFDKAIASWEKALNINPNLSEAWHNRGSALGRLGKYKEAVASFQKALAIDPNNYQAWNDRAHALYQLQDWSAAAKSWSNAVKITPGNHLFWYNRGCALEQLENWAESISSYAKSLEIKPDFQPARSRYTNLIADNSRSN